MIKIVNGVYGHYINGKVVPKDKNAEPFELTPEQEERLVNLGVAKYVGGTEPVGEEAPSNEAAPVEDDAPVEEGKSLDDMTVNELRELGKEYGLTFKVGMKKADMVAAILAASDEAAPVEDDGEDAPSFDAADAVV